MHPRPGARKETRAGTGVSPIWTKTPQCAGWHGTRLSKTIHIPRALIRYAFHLMSEKDEAATTPIDKSEESRASCFDVISMLEHQLRTARALLDALTDQGSPATQASMVVVADYCKELRAEAIEVVKATAMLHDEVCNRRTLTRTP